ncbi:MAG: sugar phosphate nucleotidyltransferase, partial [Nannocystaceae bacterium]
MVLSDEVLRNIVFETDSIATALRKIGAPNHWRTLFVLDAQERVVGSISDGDIRRGLLRGLSPENNCGAFAHREFTALRRKKVSIEEIVKLRQRELFIFPLLDAEDHIERVINLHHLKSLLPVTAVVMAGGKGRRLRPLTNEAPKPMLPVGDSPILEINIRRLVSYGVEDIYICVNYLKEQIVEHFGDGSRFGCRIQYITE